MSTKETDDDIQLIITDKPVDKLVDKPNEKESSIKETVKKGKKRKSLLRKRPLKIIKFTKKSR